MGNSEVSARALGWFSLGMGAVQVAAPRAFARAIGYRGDGTGTVLTRVVGLRELVVGVGLLSQPRPAVWQWARVAGDVMDLTLLSLGLTSRTHGRERLAAAVAAVGGITIADLLTARELDRGTIEFAKAITINRSPAEVYQFWRDFRNFPTFMTHLESVAVIDDRLSHWTARGPAGRTFEWDAEIVDERPNELIAWRSLPGAEVDNSGTVRFQPGPRGRGTEVRVEIVYEPPAGELGATIARLFGREPTQQVQADLRKVKQVLETGEVLLSEATLDAALLLQRPAQPPRELAATPAR
jgi:uncharacterized membrane protein